MSKDRVEENDSSAFAIISISIYFSFFFPGEKIGSGVNMAYIISTEKEEILSISQQPNMLTARDGNS
jgi:hypothetical protein